MTENIIARRYAKALFSLGAKIDGEPKGKARGKKKAPEEPPREKFGTDLNTLAETLEASPELLRVMANPIFSAEEKRAVLGKVMEKLSPHPMIVNFVGLLADKGRLVYLPEIAAYYGVLLDADKGIVRGELVTALALSKAKQTAIKKKLEKQLAKTLMLDFDVNEDILGGVVLKVGDKVLDASLRAQLQMLKEKIKRGE
ncbi:ATP synthase F1 subunit delta [Desulfovibrio inopinatus]|uniref:ATP synthase F1 subunit delta n=1 Tax=Desulfovibrio inopinatus TaxID=102109 RepID=UPI000413CD12|nr:ATP synthase F1 subunit delta [Desulfovibrio inopinatus]